MDAVPASPGDGETTGRATCRCTDADIGKTLGSAPGTALVPSLDSRYCAALFDRSIPRTGGEGVAESPEAERGSDGAVRGLAGAEVAVAAVIPTVTDAAVTAVAATVPVAPGLAVAPAVAPVPGWLDGEATGSATARCTRAAEGRTLGNDEGSDKGNA